MFKENVVWSCKLEVKLMLNMWKALGLLLEERRDEEKEGGRKIWYICTMEYYLVGIHTLSFPASGVCLHSLVYDTFLFSNLEIT
jgi:hypothetical protein